jgi:hypothetical protein
MPDLGELLSHAERALEDGFAGRAAAPRGVAGAKTRIRRRRAVRQWSQGVGAVAAVGLIAAGAWIGVDHRHTPAPAESPTPSVSTPAPTPTPTAAPSPTPAPSETATSAALTNEPNLPPYRPLTPEILAQVGSGWVVTLHETSPFPQDGRLPDPPIVLLASPSGDLYRAAPVTGAGSYTTVLRWSVDSDGTVVVLNGGERSLLDLATGTITADTRGLEQSSAFLGLAADGREVWTSAAGTYLVGKTGRASLASADQTWLLSPDGRRALVSPESNLSVTNGATITVVDLLTGRRADVSGVVPDGAPACSVAGWLSSSTLIESCGALAGGEVDSSGLHYDEIVTVQISADRATTSVVHHYAPDEPRIFQTKWVGDGLVVGLASRDGECMGVFTWDAQGTPTPIKNSTWSDDSRLGMDSLQVAGHIAYVARPSACVPPFEPLLSTLTSHDLASGTSTVLSPLPATSQPNVDGLTSFAVAQ